jgi:hypothetical protein
MDHVIQWLHCASCAGFHIPERKFIGIPFKNRDSSFLLQEGGSLPPAAKGRPARRPDHGEHFKAIHQYAPAEQLIASRLIFIFPRCNFYCGCCVILPRAF